MYDDNNEYLPQWNEATEAQFAANRANAQHSTGPRTEEGKAKSCLNNFKYGFCSSFVVLPSESQLEFDSLLSALRREHAPSTPTENILVDNLAQHFWLSQRALVLQSMSMSDGRPAAEAEKSFSLYLRYQVTNDRAFSKSLHDLLRLRAEKRKEESDRAALAKRTEDAARAQAEELRKQQAHDNRVRIATAQAERQQSVEKLLPDEKSVPFRTLKRVVSIAIEQAARELDPNGGFSNAA